MYLETALITRQHDCVFAPGVGTNVSWYRVEGERITPLTSLHAGLLPKFQIDLGSPIEMGLRLMRKRRVVHTTGVCGL
jgi:hypothetical protein